MLADDGKQHELFEGRVVLTQGTRAARGPHRRAPGQRRVPAGIAIGAPATFRQKRDGATSGSRAKRCASSTTSEAERVELFDKARVTRDKDEVRGNYISYDSRGEVYRVQGAKELQAAPATRDGRVRAVIQPKKKDEPGARHEQPPALELKPAPSLETSASSALMTRR